MRRLMIAMLCLLGALLPAGSHASDNLDVAPSTRSPVRVVIVRERDDYILPKAAPGPRKGS